MDVREFVEYLRTKSEMAGQIAHLEEIPPREAVYADLEQPLDSRLEGCLRAKGLWPLYSHQAQAVDTARRGDNVFIATPAASGKSLGYYIPVMQTLLTDDVATTLYLSPTKALAQDQLKHVKDLFAPEAIGRGDFATFDGDTPASDRTTIRASARLIFSNPDMLHVGILPNHQNWRRFLANLKYVIIDEAHLYRGVFGSHLALLLRRLRRVCRRYGAKPQFLMASATIGNPLELAALLTGLDFSVVDADGSPYGGKDFIFWNPPLIDPNQSTRRSASAEATFLFAELIAHGIRTLAFARSRRLAEVIFVHARERLLKTAPEKVLLIKPYRAGYLAEDRRLIEKELFAGRLEGAVTTSALELGVDIGSLDATLITGYPGSSASVWQQAGRSGRRRQRSLSVLVARNDPLDQYYMRHPEFFFEGLPEYALLNPENPYISGAHLLCAAWEMPLSPKEFELFGPSFRVNLDSLVRRGLLKERLGRYYPSADISYPAGEISIRGIGGKEYTVIDGGSGVLLEVLDSATAMFQLFPGAVYLHQGESYIVRDLDLETRIVRAEPFDGSYYTEVKDITELRVQRVLKSLFIRGTAVKLGEVEVSVTVVGFKRKAQYTEEVLGEGALSLPPQRFETVAVWFEIPAHLADRLSSGLDLAGAIHAVEHAAIGVLPLFALCDRNDIGGLSTPLHPDTGEATIFIYDAHPGGVGIAEKGYEILLDWWEATLSIITECPCNSGCPACVQSPKCGNNNEPLDKAGATALLNGLLGVTVSGKQTD
ncbi:helicase/secretion neighborhood putative DEAH-box helicase [Dehalogenimonas alkenigignens]|uniref:Helicase/secretion neighborhood putative DEAH-box helicase n=1 Tax=Dehalogenimonas alkenigignens TaxID=1217799 RepID=A0A0W0GII8_9CHLR|nr:DEAD/DEAH box helicase [Dehalogenimonas alkenigignens]KTB48384.1 helicase/secretion neighborhood putative DEAH-box helicase [Dehalogenimonas alkenigignens]